jgi:predicted DNA binding CopG/RHH family protein
MSKPKIKNLKSIPDFTSEDAEAQFWLENDTADYVDWSKAERVTLPNLKLSTKSISLRLPSGLLNNIKVLANKKDVPYQSLMKIMLDEAVRKEIKPAK